MAKVLALLHTLACPPRSGVTQRTFHLLDQLARRHEVSALVQAPPEEADRIQAHFGPRCRSVRVVVHRRPRWASLLRRVALFARRRSLFRLWHAGAMQAALDEALCQGPFDAFFLSAPPIAFYRRPRHIPCIIDTHNVEHDLLRRLGEQAPDLVRRLYYLDQRRLLRREELALCRQADVLLATSERDLRLFRRDLPATRMRVVPNGVDLDYFAPSPRRPRRPSIVFTGLMRYPPNDQGMRWFLDRVFPLVQQEEPETTLTIVGAEPARWLRRRASERIVVTGQVDDVRPYVADSQVFVIPVLTGGGTRLKALEAMAMQRPIVSTTVGCEGLGLRQGETVLLADRPEEFARAVVGLLQAPARASRLAQRAYAVAVSRYGWDSVGARLDRAVQLALSGRAAGARRRPTSLPWAGVGSCAVE